MSIQRHVFEAMMIIAKPVTAREIHKRARGLRYTSEQIGVALRAMARRGIVVETRPERPRVAAQYILVEKAKARLLAGQQPETPPAAPPRKSEKVVRFPGNPSPWLVMLCEGKADESIVDAIVRRGYRMTSVDRVEGHNAYRFERKGGVDGGGDEH